MKKCVFLLLPALAIVLLSKTSGLLSALPSSQWERKETELPSLSLADSSHSSLARQEQLTGRRSVTLIVRLGGEMANLLSHWVFAKGVQLWMEENIPDIHVTLIGERQRGTKWKGAVENVQACFPNLRGLEYQGGRWDPDFVAVRQQQIDWVGEDNHRQKLIIDAGDADCGTKELFCLHKKLAYFQSLLQMETNATTTNLHKYSLPFLVTNQLASFDVLVDQYYNQILEWLEFDYQACCAEDQPALDEVVLHLRNFRAEMRERNFLERGYEELSPSQVANELLGHLPAGTRVAIASRGDSYVQPVVDALHKRGLKVRRTVNRTGVQDFCFLLQANKELVGTMRSTYTRWAVLLGKAQRAQLYSIDSAWNRKLHGDNGSQNFTTQLHYPWKRPKLQQKIRYRVFPSDFEATG
ncbi:expressed unknown protein [Seminavis robusta]|uniref:Uncharacterized protein n=1 Tax=Seminavis robusta TaxID=568900 RepID=A0A9N8EKQ4_9STRA|nr:expressed unknown protein [Seminavis robusta]|eukprot:Sro1159_g247600.1 n/a (411) ;mRNA; r:18537-19910